LKESVVSDIESSFIPLRPSKMTTRRRWLGAPMAFTLREYVCLDDSPTLPKHSMKNQQRRSTKSIETAPQRSHTVEKKKGLTKLLRSTEHRHPFPLHGGVSDVGNVSHDDTANSSIDTKDIVSSICCSGIRVPGEELGWITEADDDGDDEDAVGTKHYMAKFISCLATLVQNP
jgi:hypothetical protein